METKHSFDKLAGIMAKTRFLNFFYSTNLIQVSTNKTQFHQLQNGNVYLTYILAKTNK